MEREEVDTMIGLVQGGLGSLASREVIEEI